MKIPCNTLVTVFPVGFGNNSFVSVEWAFFFFYIFFLSFFHLFVVVAVMFVTVSRCPK